MNTIKPEDNDPKKILADKALAALAKLQAKLGSDVVINLGPPIPSRVKGGAGNFTLIVKQGTSRQAFAVFNLIDNDFNDKPLNADNETSLWLIPEATVDKIIDHGRAAGRK